MNILYIVPYVPSQIYTRPYNLIQQLTAHGHQLTVLAISSSGDDIKAIQHLKQFCHQVVDFSLPSWRSYVNCLIALPTSDPLQSAYSWQPDLIRHAMDLIESNNIDVIHIEHLRGARYGLAVRELMYRSKVKARVVPIVWDSVDCITHLFKQTAKHSSRRASKFITYFELRRTEQYEAKLVKRFDHTLVTSDSDRDAMLALSCSREDQPQISVLPNGVDLEYFLPSENITRENETIVISGKMSYHANVTMVMYLVNEIMPIVWLKKPTAQVWIVGKNPPKSVLSLGNHPSITVTGAVHDLRPYLQRATISVAPLRYGAGIQNKVLEAMACSTPVITTPQGVNALKVKVGEEIIVGKDPITFAGAIINLLESPQTRERIGKAGRNYVKTNHNWRNVSTQLENVYLETINQHLRSS